MNRVAVYEAETLPVPDPKEIDDDIADRIRTAFQSLLDGGVDARRELDRAVLAAIGEEDRVTEVTGYAKALSKARQEQTEIGEFVSGLEGGGSAKTFQITDPSADDDGQPSLSEW